VARTVFKCLASVNRLLTRRDPHRLADARKPFSIKSLKRGITLAERPKNVFIPLCAALMADGISI
jgi:hypothetical protein